MSQQLTLDAGLPDERHPFAPCLRDRHADCIRTYPGCGWDGRRLRPAPRHVCSCSCHAGDRT